MIQILAFSRATSVLVIVVIGPTVAVRVIVAAVFGRGSLCAAALASAANRLRVSLP
jgi:hypothetical protein